MNAACHVFQLPGFVCILDRHRGGCRCVSNHIERIVDEDLSLLLAVPGVRLICRDSKGRWDEVLIKRYEGVASFAGFEPITDDQLVAEIDMLTPAFFGDPADDGLLAMGYERPFKVLDDGRIAALQSINTWFVVLAVGIYGHGHEDAYYYRSRARRSERWVTGAAKGNRRAGFDIRGAVVAVTTAIRRGSTSGLKRITARPICNCGSSISMQLHLFRVRAACWAHAPRSNVAGKLPALPSDDDAVGFKTLEIGY
ncbi:hypothetical protein [Caballeronia sp. ATUFL_M1_KS5A]|jgi:hypothetical protein|uniref:hypothetical protein n=1 Tax=Caballeronia sp. ATUFL_M1_KS5A TaxID=2921778 RepID=UPI0020280C94|nr:hypothetical protein [Caballeronia sp. ATUFL_M1_KS5A]